MPAEIEFDPDVFHGELTANRAQVFVRAPRAPDLADCTLHGYVHGPRCEYAHTLPAKFPLRDLGAGPALLARTTVTDPCLWTSDLPQIYDVHIELRRGAEVLAREQRLLGLRGIGARTTGETPQLVREGKVWVPRGVALESLETIEVAGLREQLLIGVCTSPPLDLLVEASRRGLYLIVRLDHEKQDVPLAIRHLARWPAVIAASIRHGESLDRSLSQLAPNLLLLQEMDSSSRVAPGPAAWAAAVLVALQPGETQVDSELDVNALPWLVRRPPGVANLTPTQARAECDRLQRDLVDARQFSGYLV